MKYKIYIVEDDISISSLLKDYIEKYDFTVKLTKNFDSIMEEFNFFKPDLVLMDVNLPKFDGFYWCRRIRELSIVPIIFISARESGMDQVMALENGADDYITKPFYSEVVLAKIKSHIRRAFGNYAVNTDERVVELDDLKFYPERLELKFKEKTLVITKKEGILLECLMKSYPRVVSRDYLLEKIWDDTAFVEENTLNVNVTRLRKRLQEFNIGNEIEAIRGVGYKLNKNW
ncbi:response regulator transcription factor [Clostridium magnum]|uniref:Stage 0 sporulation protein A homolog n=1 Tax=Clostridium magnum DSM 2767 TaxID=1121326 RepID=A0A162QHP4_9CLOT|nr:response regulator transcription factor [Clostridium magnum]KZL88537.1 response regulator protein GraR [Clostridium magnum DSM 2767]SHI14613.1 DNA-binding response regulator, OmpR family, contains REC and winged-helix (wHTH) domain [Clostridium magnum DSM 2767]